MIPLRDSTPSSTAPVVVYAIIATCVAVFLYTVGLGSEARIEAFYTSFGAVPHAVTTAAPGAYWGLLTSMFLHGGWLHLGGNMLFLWVFGDNIEDAMGHFRFVIFYLLTGLIATFSHIVTQPASAVPLVGASGAIAGVLGGYLVLYPRAHILSLVFLGYFARVVELPAVVVLGLWFLIQVMQGFVALGSSDVASIAFWAHVGGFVAGVVLVKLFAARRRRWEY
jgi:membrane associated rhomboid family serine protease